MSAIARATAFTVVFELYDSSTGLLKTGATSLASSVSKDAGALTATTNSVTEISGGLYSLLLTATEMTATTVDVKVTATDCLSKTIHVVTDQVEAEVLAVPTAVENADTLLARPISSVEGGSHPFRSLYGMIAKLVNKTSASLTTLTVTETDDATPLATQALTRDATAEPVTEVNTN